MQNVYLNALDYCHTPAEVDDSLRQIVPYPRRRTPCDASRETNTNKPRNTQELTLKSSHQPFAVQHVSITSPPRNIINHDRG